MAISNYFPNSIPDYLSRHYWWAYLWQPTAWFFDHQPIINAILFGQYKKLMQLTLNQLRDCNINKVLQLSCAYGKFSPALVDIIKPRRLHLTDVSALQLEMAKQKSPSLCVGRMNAEKLAYKDNSFSTIVIFFLLHEMPAAARKRCLQESIRVLAPGGTLLITEYAYLPSHHVLYRFPVFHYVLTVLEPFLDDFWHEDQPALLERLARAQNKSITHEHTENIFNGFYRMEKYKLMSH